MAGADASDMDKQSWRAYTLKHVYRGYDQFEQQIFPPVQVTEDCHKLDKKFKSTVLYKFPIGVVGNKEAPKPYVKKPKWDASHVRLPNAIECQCPVYDESGKEVIKTTTRWELIKDAFSEPINTISDLQNAILVYNPDFKELWHFQALHTLLIDDLEVEEVEEFFKDLLPRIISLAFQLPDLIRAPIPLLEQNTNNAISLTQQQVSCLLANAFLCTFPNRSNTKRWLKKDAEYYSYSDINFHGLYQSFGSPVTEKLKCLLNYFRRVTDATNVPTGVVTFVRKSLDPYDFPDWDMCEASIGDSILHINSAGAIEDGAGLLQVDFADKYVGGGVLGFRCEQEEIRFSISPELIVAKLFTECLLPNEALFMIGCEQYNSFRGFSTGFKWTGNYIDDTPRDSSKRRQIAIVAIDAFHFREKAEQYQEKFLLRELNKAYVGFWCQNPKRTPGIATGNWGCGAFRGDSRLKALIQMMAACVTDRPLAYYTFSDAELRDDFFKIYYFLKKRKTRICDLFDILKEFSTQNLESKELYKFIRSRLRNRP